MLQQFGVVPAFAKMDFIKTIQMFYAFSAIFLVLLVLMEPALDAKVVLVIQIELMPHLQ